MTRTLILLIVIALTTSCKQKSTVFRDCSCDQVDLKNGLTIKDTLGNYQIKYPDESWLPILNLDSNGNGISVGDTSLGYLRMFAVTFSEILLISFSGSIGLNTKLCIIN